jgi:hypothetical protein
MQRLVECAETSKLGSLLMGDRFYLEGSCSEWLVTDGPTEEKDSLLCVCLHNGETREISKETMVYE